MAFRRSSGKHLCLAILLISSISIVIGFLLMSTSDKDKISVKFAHISSTSKSDRALEVTVNAKKLKSRFDFDHCTIIPENLLDIQQFTYKINCSRICSRKIPRIIIVVHSSVGHRHQRDIIRGTWGSVKKYGKWTLELVFLLGVDENTEIPTGEHYDVVIGNFKDSYRNLSYKHLMGYKWVGEFCAGAEYVVKVDDDVFVDVFHLIKIIESNEERYRADIIGNLMSGYKPERSDSKSEISIAEYPDPVYPDYVSGLAYVIQAQAACQIFNLHTSRPYLWIDDVFVTGVLRNAAANLTIQEINSEYFLPGPPTPKLVEWYNKENETSPPPWTFILDLDTSELGNCAWEKFGRIWTKTLASYGIRPGTGFND